MCRVCAEHSLKCNAILHWPHMWLCNVCWAAICALTGSLLWNNGATPFLMAFSRRIRKPLCFIPMALRSCAWRVPHSVTSQSSTKSSTHFCSAKGKRFFDPCSWELTRCPYTYCTYIHTSVVVPQMNSKRVYPCASKFGMNAWSCGWRWEEREERKESAINDAWHEVCTVQRCQVSTVNSSCEWLIVCGSAQALSVYMDSYIACYSTLTTDTCIPICMGPLWTHLQQPSCVCNDFASWECVHIIRVYTDCIPWCVPRTCNVGTAHVLEVLRTCVRSLKYLC